MPPGTAVRGHANLLHWKLKRITNIRVESRTRQGSAVHPVRDPRHGGEAVVRRPTLADVASASGVSTATVSYVLNDKPGQSIPEHTRERVRAATAELGYVRSGAARALARGRSDLVLLVVPDVPVGPVLVGLLERLTTACSRVGLHLLAKLSFAGDDLGALCRELLPAAVIVLVDLDPERIDPIRELRIPVARGDGLALIGTGRRRSPRRARSDCGGRTRPGRGDGGRRTSAARVRAPGGPSPHRPGRRAPLRGDGRLPRAGAARSPDPGVPSGAVSTAELRSCVEAGVTGVCAHNDDVQVPLRLSGSPAVSLKN
ncbi:LacI family DNA-binding transcriptional regulator [Corynebacterium amycolatum]|uniref:LacI family DNA-binding transcriptional regulator n=1 Tax=Corynebacterium amycolatum TaxID=43765 RepID=UPI003B595054